MDKYHINIEEIIEKIRFRNRNQDSLITVREAEKLLKRLNQYSKYVIPEKKEKWMEYLYSVLYSSLIPIKESKKCRHLPKIMDCIDIEIIDEIYAYIDAGEIMKIYYETGSWEEVEKEVKRQNNSIYSKEGINEVLLEYSQIGVEFINRYSRKSIEKNLELKRYYEEQQEYLQTRKEYYKRIINLLKEKGMEKEITPMERKLYQLIIQLENLLNSDNEEYIKTEKEMDNYQETTIRGKEISITRIKEKEELEYLILDKRYYMTLITIDGKNPINSKIEMTISDTPVKTEIKEVETSNTIKEYIDGLTKFLKDEKKEQVRRI